MQNFKNGEEPTEFRSRSKTWPSKESSTESDYVASEVDSSDTCLSNQVPSTFTLPSIADLDPTNLSWSSTSDNFTEPYIASIDSNIFHSRDNQNNQFNESNVVENANKKPKSSRRRNTDLNIQRKTNPWGGESYADLIIQALNSSPSGRLRLNDIYNWFSNNVQYFQNRSGDDSSGWKNSIRHNLSLHNRFMRIQNEGAGKSSWWCINPDAKPGRNPRRRAATMESSTKAVIDKKRRGARKRVEVSNVRTSNQGLSESGVGSQLSITSQELFNEGDDSLNSNFDRFRARTKSNASMPGKSSPRCDEYKYPPWVNSSNASSISSQLGPITSSTNVNDLLSATDKICLDSDVGAPEYCSSNSSIKDGIQQRQSPLQINMHQLKQEDIKQDPIVMQQQPPSYQEVVQNQSQMRSMHSQIQKPIMQSKLSNNQSQFYQSSVYNSVPSQMISQQAPPINAQSAMNNSTSMNNQASMSQQQSHWIQMQQPLPQMIYSQQPQFVPSSSGMMLGRVQMNQQLPSLGDLGQLELPNDLVNLANLDSQFMDTDVEAIIRTL